jgi:hypothetical protein
MGTHGVTPSISRKVDTSLLNFFLRITKCYEQSPNAQPDPTLHPHPLHQSNSPLSFPLIVTRLSSSPKNPVLRRQQSQVKRPFSPYIAQWSRSDDWKPPVTRYTRQNSFVGSVTCQPDRKHSQLEWRQALIVMMRSSLRIDAMASHLRVVRARFRFLVN